MSPRILSEWLWYLVAIYVGSFWSPARCISVRQPPSNPSTIEAQAKFFQYRHLPTHEDFDQGHRLGSEHHFTERHERSRPSAGLFSAKVRWGDKKGGYGEHYWDLNHAGHNNDHDDGYDGRNHDDGAYHDNNNSYHDDDNDPYDEPSDNSPSYGVEEYDPEKSNYDDNGRTKRAHPKVKAERKADDERVERQRKRKNTIQKPEQQTSASQQIDDKEKPEHKSHEDIQENENKEKKQVVLVLSHKDKDTDKQIKEQQSQFEPKRQRHSNHFVPYEHGAGVREHQHPEATVAASVPRLFLEPSTGHVVDRATGQAYVLQPIRNHYLES